MSWNSKKRPRKYQQGAPITSLSDRVLAAMGDEYLWCHGKPYHPKVVRQWSLVMIANAPLFWAGLTPEWMAKEADGAE